MTRAPTPRQKRTRAVVLAPLVAAENRKIDRDFAERMGLPDGTPMPCDWCVTGVDCPRHPRTGNEEGT